MPQDDAFYLGCSMETHQESPGLVSGQDLTNATPLRLKLVYENFTTDLNKEQFFSHVNGQDPLTSFVHVDAILRLQPDGTLISSV